jgi:hypothetical protein
MTMTLAFIAVASVKLKTLVQFFTFIFFYSLW